MKRRLSVGLSTVVLGMALGGGAANAHLDAPDAPNCFGVLTSHLASVHGLTPPERAVIVGGELGREISVRELMVRVRTLPHLCP